MNNITQKNIIYNLKKSTELPYQSPNDTSLKANQIIYTSVNYNMQKMIDNDLYNEKQLFSKGNYIEGPKLSTENVTTQDTPDGYIIWTPELSA